jgi:hypothetical protein
VKYLIDSSVWIAYFSRRSDIALEAICRPHEIYTTLPVYQEVLQGIKDETSFRVAAKALGSANFVESPLTGEVYDDAISIYRISRKSGVTIRSSVDCLIAACAIRNNLTVLHRDRDFSKIARISILKEKGI